MARSDFAQTRPGVSLASLADDFRNLDARDPGAWPLGPRIVALLALFAGTVVLIWGLLWRVQIEEHQGKAAEEQKLRKEWLDKKKQAVNRREITEQLKEIGNSFGVLLKQLPNRSGMESLIVDINQAGLTRGLQFQLFKPNNEVVREFYAELPITIKLTGSYHDLGGFVGDIAQMSRIVTLNDIEISVMPVTKDSKDKTVGASLSMSTTAKTFRYLEENESKRKSGATK